MILLILLLIDLHTLLLFLLYPYIPEIYTIHGALLIIAKGLIFFIPSREVFSLLDIITGLVLLLLLVMPVWGFLKVFLILFLCYKILLIIVFWN